MRAHWRCARVYVCLWVGVGGAFKRVSELVEGEGGRLVLLTYIKTAPTHYYPLPSLMLSTLSRPPPFLDTNPACRLRHMYHCCCCCCCYYCSSLEPPSTLTTTEVTPVIRTTVQNYVTGSHTIPQSRGRTNRSTLATLAGPMPCHRWHHKRRNDNASHFSRIIRHQRDDEWPLFYIYKHISSRAHLPQNIRTPGTNKRVLQYFVCEKKNKHSELDK